MTIEIRELVIKTEVNSQAENKPQLSSEAIQAIKNQIISECRRTLQRSINKGNR